MTGSEAKKMTVSCHKSFNDGAFSNTTGKQRLAYTDGDDDDDDRSPNTTCLGPQTISGSNAIDSLPFVLPEEAIFRKLVQSVAELARPLFALLKRDL